MTTQLPLQLSLRQSSTFANFSPGHNRELLDLLMKSAGAPVARVLFIWGETGSGKTHLLEALCHAVAGAGAYVPLAQPELTPALLEGLEAQRFVCLDDVQAVAGDAAWETALFQLYERMGGESLLIATADASPRHLALRLPDLATRLAAGPIYQVHALDDNAKRAVLRERARGRGLTLSEEAASYLLARHPRDMHALMALLERIDQAALAQQLAITIPFRRGLD